MQGWLEDLTVLLESATANGGLVSYRSMPDGGQQPYEINSNWLSLMKGPERSEELGIKRFLLAHAVLLAMPGLPAIYIHSILGSENDVAGVASTGRNRSINRERLSAEEVARQLTSDGLRKTVFDALRQLISVRQECEAFYPHGEFEFPKEASPLFVILRHGAQGTVSCIYNLGGDHIRYALEGSHVDLITGKSLEHVALAPYGFAWVTRIG